MTDARYTAHPTARVAAQHSVQIVRTYDGMVFAMSPQEARDLAYQLDRSADQADLRRPRPAHPNGDPA